MTRTPQDAPVAEALASSLALAADDPFKADQLHTIFGKFCHDFRNLLNSLRMSLYLARRATGPDREAAWLDLEPRYSIVERFIDRFHLICRPMNLSFVKLPLDVLFDDRKTAWSQLLLSRGRNLILVAPSGLTVGDFDPMRLGSGFDDLVAWRAVAGGPQTDLRVRWSTDARSFRVDWDEPPCSKPLGLDDPSRENPPPIPLEADLLAALTLPLLTKIMSSHGGSLQTGGSDGDRWRLNLRWPLDARHTLREATPCSAPASSQ